MKWLLIVVLLFVSSCVTARYNTETKELSYQRFGDQKLGGVEVVLSDGSYVIIENQKSEARILTDALRLIEKGIEIGTKIPLAPAEPNMVSASNEKFEEERFEDM